MDYLKENHWPRRPKDNHDLNVAACRLIMNLLPGLELTVVFESVSKIKKKMFQKYIPSLNLKKLFFISLQMIYLSKDYSIGLIITVSLCKHMQQDF